MEEYTIEIVGVPGAMSIVLNGVTISGPEIGPAGNIIHSWKVTKESLLHAIESKPYLEHYGNITNYEYTDDVDMFFNSDPVDGEQ